MVWNALAVLPGVISRGAQLKSTESVRVVLAYIALTRPLRRRAALYWCQMIVTKCAACVAPLPHPAKQCSRCKTLYCGPACQAQHWKEGGHDKLCKKIRKCGGAE